MVHVSHIEGGKENTLVHCLRPSKYTGLSRKYNSGSELVPEERGRKLRTAIYVESTSLTGKVSALMT
jgi:hypothetical protein